MSIRGVVTSITMTPNGPVHSAASITTEDGTVIARDLKTGRSASGRTIPEALAALRRLKDGSAR